MIYCTCAMPPIWAVKIVILYLCPCASLGIDFFEMAEKGLTKLSVGDFSRWLEEEGIPEEFCRKFES